MMFTSPIEVAEYYAALYGGIALDPDDDVVWGDPDTKELDRWCPCGCRQTTTAGVPCFDCGAVGPRRPKPDWWPTSTSSSTIKNGDQFLVAELREEGGPGCPTP